MSSNNMESKSQDSLSSSSESEPNLRMSSSSDSDMSDGECKIEMPTLRRSRKELDLRIFTPHRLSTDSVGSHESMQSMGENVTNDQIRVVWRRRTPKPDEDIRDDNHTVTCSVLKALDQTRENSSETLSSHSEEAGTSTSRGSEPHLASKKRVQFGRSSSHPVLGPVKSLRNLSEAAFVRMADVVRAPSRFDIARDVNGSVDVSDILLPNTEPVIEDIASNVLLRSARGSIDITNPPEEPGNEEGLPPAGPASSPSLVDESTQSQPGNEEGLPPAGPASSPSLVDESTQSQPGNEEGLPPAGPASSPSLVDESTQNTSQMDKDQHVSFLISTSQFDIAYAVDPKESQEESPIHPGIQSPKFSAENTTAEPNPLPQILNASEMKFIQNLTGTACVAEESCNKEIDNEAISPTQHQVYVADTTKSKADNSASSLPATGEAEQVTSPEVNPDGHSDLEPTTTSSASVRVTASTSMLETLQHTGSVRLLENLPGLDGQWGEFGQAQKLPTAEEQEEVEEEMLRLATRAKRYVPPMEVGLCEWDSIVKILAMNEPVSVERVLCWLSKITTKRYCDLVRLYRCGLYDKVLSLLLNHPEVPLIQNLTIKLIAEMCILPGCSHQILENPPLVLHCITLLEDDNSSLHFHECSSKILSAIGHDRYIQRALLRHHDLIEVLLRRIINSPDPDVRCNCLELLIRVSNNATTCKQLIASEQFTLELFTTLIDSKYAKIQQLALGMWELFTRYETGFDFQSNVQASGMPDFVMRILQTESMQDFSHLAIAIFCNVAKTSFGLGFLEETGAVKFLVDYIDQPGKESLLGCGLDIVVKLSVTKMGRAMLVEFEVPIRLVKYLKYDDDTTLERSCLAMANVCQNLEALSTMVANEPAEDLIRLIYEDLSAFQLKYAAARALFELASRSESVCRQITDQHLTKVFHHLISTGFSHIPTLGIISDTIQTISQYPEMKIKMIDVESVACLLDIMQGHCRESTVSEYVPEDADHLRIDAMQCLRCYMSDPLCRNLFADAYGVYVLLDNLKSLSIMIKQATALFIDLAAQDPNLARQMAIAGIVPVMRDDKAMMVACPAWKKALQQIYDHHLPSKFAYCHRLDTKDITSEGFYIAATMKGAIEIMDNLLRDKRCPLETLYVCNFLTEVPKAETSGFLSQLNIKKISYPAALADLGQTSVAKIWQRKVILLYGDLISPNLSRESLLECVSPTASEASGRKASIKKRTNSLNRRIKGRKSKNRGPSRTSMPTAPNTSQSSESKNDGINSSLEKFGVCPVDNDLAKYLDDLLDEMKEKMGLDDEGEEDSRNSFLADKGLVKAVEILAKFVVLRMSGATDNIPNLVNFFRVSVWELKERDGLNIIPLGHLKAGLHLERALLFKILADKIGLPCTFVRGEYGIAFNEICVPCPNNDFPVPWMEMRPNYVVDLMRNIGEIYFLGDWEAALYCKSPF